LIPREVRVEDNGGSTLRGRQGKGRWWWLTLREVESRSMSVARSEGGRVEVDSGSTTITKSLRRRTVVACSEAEVEAVVCSRARIEDSRWWRWCGGF
jgi:hypothetical protein